MVFFRKYIHNKYFYTGLAFLVWMIFFDQENFVEQYRLSKNLNDLAAKKAYYQTEISKNEKAIHSLENDSTQVEKFAREKYFMKKDNEEVFVIIREEE
jgi:cell division protein FtsB